MKTLLAAAAALAATAAATTATPGFAHGATRPQHGGIVATNGETLFELVAKPAGTQLFVLDEDEPVTASAMTATLTVAGAAKPIALRPAAGNRFDGPPLTLKPGARVAVMVIDTTSQAHLGGTFVIR